MERLRSAVVTASSCHLFVSPGLGHWHTGKVAVGMAADVLVLQMGLCVLEIMAGRNTARDAALRAVPGQSAA